MAELLDSKLTDIVGQNYNQINNALLQDTADRISKTGLSGKIFDSKVLSTVPEFKLPSVIDSYNDGTKLDILSDVRNKQTSKEALDPNYKKMMDYYATGNAISKGGGNTGLYVAGKSNVFSIGDKEDRFGDESLGYRHDINNEQAYADATGNFWGKGFFKHMGNFLGRTAVPLVTKTLSGLSSVGSMIGKIPYTAAMAYLEPDANVNMADNAFSRTLDGWEDSWKNDVLPIYQSATNNNQGFFYRMFNDPTLYTGDLSDGLAFLGSAYVTGGVASWAGLGSKAFTLLSKVAPWAVEGEAATLAATDLYTAQRAKVITDGYLKNAVKWANGLDNLSVTMLNSASEANIEAKEIRDSVYNDLILKGYSAKEADELSAKAYKGTFLTNMAILGVSNHLFETNLIMNSIRKESNAAINGIKKGAKFGEDYVENKWTNTLLGKYGDNAIAKGAQKLTDSKLGYYGGKIIEGTAFEGFWEENAQTATQRYFKNENNLGQPWYKQLQGVANQYANQTIDAIKGDDPEVANAIGLGGMIAAIGIGGTGLTTKEYAKQKADRLEKISTLNKLQTNLFAANDIYQKDENGVIVKDAAGNPKVDDNKAKALEAKLKVSGFKTILTAGEKSPTGKRMLSKQAFAEFVLGHLDTKYRGDVVANTKIDNWVSSIDENGAKELGYEDKQSFQKEMESLKDFNTRVWKMNQEIENDINFKPKTKEDELVQNLRRVKLHKSGILQLLLQDEIDVLQKQKLELEGKLKTGVASEEKTMATKLNKIVSQLNYNNQYLKQIEQDTATFTEASNLQDKLKAELDEVKGDESSDAFKKLKKNKEGYYEVPGETQSIDSEKLQKTTDTLGQFENMLRIENAEWYHYANEKSGFDNYKEAFFKSMKQAESQDTPPNWEDGIDKNAKRLSYTVKASDGSESEIELVEGEVYISKANEKKVFLKNGKTATIKNHNRVVINKVDGDFVTLTIEGYDGKETITVHKDELSEYGPLYNKRSLSPLGRFYVEHADDTFTYQISLGKNNGTFIFRDKNWRKAKTDDEIAEAAKLKGKQMLQTVQARLGFVNKNVAKDKEEALLIKFINPLSKKEDSREYNPTWFNKNRKSAFFDLSTLPDDYQKALADLEAKRQLKLTTQRRYFDTLISEVEKEAFEATARTQENQKAYEEAVLSIIDNKAALEEAQSKLEEILGNPDNFDKRKKNKKELKAAFAKEAQNYKDLIQKLSNTIIATEKLIESLEKENQDIAKRLEALKEAENFYYEQYGILEENDEAIDVSKATITEKEKELGDLQTSAINNTVPNLESLIEDIESEKKIIEEKISKLKGYIDDLKSFLNKFKLGQLVLEKLEELNDVKAIKDFIWKVVGNAKTEEEKALNQKLLKVYQSFDDVENILFALNSTKDSIKELSELEDQLNYLNNLQDQFRKGIEDRYQIETKTNDLNVLKKLYDTFMQILNTETKANVAAQVTNASAIPNEVTDSTDEAIDTLVDKERISASKPELNELTINKTASRHYNNDDTLVDDEGAVRYHNFAASVNFAAATSAKQPYAFKVVTVANDTFGILYENEKLGYKKETDVKLVMVKLVGSEYKYVNEKGEVLENPTKDTIVYTSMHNDPRLNTNTDEHKLAWAREAFDTSNLSPEKVLKLVNGFLEEKARVMKTVSEGHEVTLRLVSRLPGVQNKQKTADGKFPHLGVEGILIPENATSSDYDDVVLQIATSADKTYDSTRGSTSLGGRQIPVGNTVIFHKESGHTISVYNRNLTDSELKTLAKAITAFYKTFNKSKDKLTEEEANEKLRLQKFIEGLVFWSVPDEGKAIGKHQMWISNGLHFGPDTLLTEFTVNEDSVYDLLKSNRVYHTVNKTKVSENNAFNVPTFTSKGVEWKEWHSYKEYLLSSKDGREAPIYTNNVPYSQNNQTPFIKNSQFVFTFPSVPAGSVQSSPAKLEETADVKDFEVVKSNFEISQGLTIGSKLENNLPATFPKVEKLNDLPDGTYAPVFDIGHDSKLVKIILKKEGTKFTIVTTNVAVGGKDITFEKEGIEAVSYVMELLNPNLPLETVRTNITLQYGTGKIFLLTPKVKEEKVEEPVTEAPFATEGEDIDLSGFDGDGYLGDNDGSIEYRLIMPGDEASETENISQFMSWLQVNLPQFAVQIEKEAIDKKAHGSFTGNLITLWENAKAGTGFHEAFEAVWNTLLTADQKIDLLTEFKNRSGSFKYAFGGQIINYKDATPSEAKETLAEEFVVFMNSNGTDLYKGLPKKNNFFRRIWNFIKSLFGVKPESIQEAKLKADELFKAISEGKFSKVNPTEFFGLEYRPIKGLSQTTTSQIINNIHSNFFRHLFKSNESIESLMSKDNKELINNLFDKAKDSLLLSIRKNINFLEEKLKTATGAEKIKLQELATFNYNLAKIVDLHYKDRIIPTYREFLKKYKLSFTESDDMNDENNSVAEEIKSKDYGLDAAEIDSRNLLNTSVRLLLASIPESKYVNGVLTEIPSKDAYGAPMLVNYGKVINILLNDLSGIVPVTIGNEKVDRLDIMFKTLDDKYKDGPQYKEGYEWIAHLKARLKYEDYSGRKYSKEEWSDSDVKFLIGFEKSFSNNQFKPIKLFVKKGGNIVFMDAVTDSNMKMLKSTWISNAKNLILNKSKELILNQQGELLIDKDQLTNEINGATTIKSDLNLLSKLGIVLTIPTDIIEVTGTDDNVKFKKAISSIKEVIKTGKVKTINNLYSRSVDQAIRALMELELANRQSDKVLMYRNSENKNEYTVTIPSTYSNIINTLNNTKNQYDFIASNPQLGVVENGNVILNAYQRNSILMKIGGLLFNDKGSKIKNIEILRISGISQEGTSEGESTKSLTFIDRAAQELNLLLNGVYYTVINSDKSSEFGMKLGHPVRFENIDKTAEIVNKFYIGHLEDEITPILEYHKAKAEGKQVKNIQVYTQLLEDMKLGHFADIFPDISGVIKDILNPDSKTTLASFLASPETVTRLINYIDAEKYDGNKKGLVKEMMDYMLDNGLVVKDPNNNKIYRSIFLSNELLKGFDINNKNMSFAEFKSLAKFMVVNSNIITREQHKLAYGDPRMYKDLPKRSNGVNSTKEAIVDNTKVISWMDVAMPRMDKKIRSNDVDQTFTNISFKDVDVISSNLENIATSFYESLMKDYNGDKERVEKTIGAKFDENGKLLSYQITKDSLIAGYAKLTEADAQGYLMADMYRDLLFLSGKLSTKQKDLIDYEFAYERQVRSGELAGKDGKKLSKSDPAYKDFYPNVASQKIKEQDEKIIKKGRPDAILPTLKPQYFGYNSKFTRSGSLNEVQMQHTSFLKNSTTPLFFSIVEGRPAQELYLKAQKNQVDVIGFESGQKVGNTYASDNKFPSLYKAGKVNPNMSVVQSMYTRFLGIQVEMAAKTKKEIPRGSQITKLILTNLFEHGKEINEGNYEKAREYMAVLDALIYHGKNKLISRLGLIENEDGSVETENLKQLVDTLRGETTRMDMPDNVTEMLYLNPDNVKELKYVFDAGPVRDKLEYVIMSIVDSSIVHQKMNGKMSAQVASTMFEQDGSRKFARVNKTTGFYEEVSAKEIKEDDSVLMTSTDLKFYADDKGMEVYLPWYYAEKLGLESTDVTNLDPRLLELIGYRIPTQSLGQIEFITIKGFLDKSLGDVVVVPSEIVTKSGSDFDIDKLSLYLPNAYRGKDGEIRYVEYDNDMSTEGIERRYNKRHTKWRRLLSSADKFIANVKNIEELSSNAITDKIFGKFDDDLTEDEILKEYAAEDKPWAYTYNHIKMMANKEAANSPSYEEFVRLPIEMQNTVEALQNRNIQLMKDIMLIKGNMRQMLMPNSAKSLKDLEGEIYGLLGEETETTSRTKLGELPTMSKIRHVFLNAKALVGVGAIQITSHTVCQLGNITLTGLYKKNGSEIPLNILLEHKKDSDGLYTLANITTADGKYISEILSEFLSGFVDAAKDPFIFNINVNFNTAATWFYLLKMGVPLKNVAYFMNQPIIREYIKRLDNSNSAIAKYNNRVIPKHRIRKGLVAKYAAIARVSKVENISKDLFTLKALENGLKSNKNLDANQAYNQLAYLEEFLRYGDQAQHLGMFINSLAVDTRSTKTMIENELLIQQRGAVMEDGFIANSEDAFNKTFLGGLHVQRSRVADMLEPFFVTASKKVMPDMIDAVRYLSSKMISSEAKENFLNKYQGFILSYILQNGKIVRKLANGTKVKTKLSENYNLFTSSPNQKSIARELIDVKNKYKGNAFLEAISPALAENEKDTDNIELFKTGMSSYDINVAAESLFELHRKTKLNDPETFRFLNRLIVFSILQSGQMQSPINYSKIIHESLYLGLSNDIFKEFLKSDEKLPRFVWKQFFQNNWKNADIVPVLDEDDSFEAAQDKLMSGENSINGGSILGNGLISLTKYSNGFTHDFVRFNHTNASGEYDNYGREIEEVTPMLYEAIGMNENGNRIYRAINKLGNGMYGIETYETDTAFMKESDIKFSFVNGYVKETNFDSQATEQTSKVNLSDNELSDNNSTFVKGWARYANGVENYEVSTEGDSRFSALNAKLKDGRTIEEAYQLDVKGYRKEGNDWKLGKGKAPLNKMSKEESYQAYKNLWKQWALENPNLMKELSEKSSGKILTDKFANTDVSQARALSEILKENSENQIEEVLKNKECKS